MTSTSTAPPPVDAVGAEVSTGSTGNSGFWRRNRVWFLVGTALALALVVSVWATGSDLEYSAPLDPQNPEPDGAQALAQVLEGQGVEVTIVRSADDLHATRIDERTTVVVTDTDQLAPSTIGRLGRDTTGADVILVDPPPYVLAEIDARVEPAYAADLTTGDCTDDRFDRLDLTVDRAAGYHTRDGCFPSNGGFVLAQGPGAIVFFGAGQALSNDQVLRGDNAAVALRLLGRDDRLVWYVPTFADAGDDEAVSLWTFAPGWVAPSLWLAAFSVIAMIWWRGRRMGKLATEPLPVVVRAVETTRSRGRMYRRANDRTYAGVALRAAARRRLTDHLRLGRGAPEADVIEAVARHLGRPASEIAALLAHQAPVPGSDQGLVQLAQELTDLDREVRRG